MEIATMTILEFYHLTLQLQRWLAVRMQARQARRSQNHPV
jgi:hypothetical protein